MNIFPWFKTSVCLGNTLLYTVARFPHFREEQTETHREKGPTQDSKLVIELGLEPRFFDSQPAGTLSMTPLVFACHSHRPKHCAVLFLRYGFLCIKCGPPVLCWVYPDLRLYFILLGRTL